MVPFTIIYDVMLGPSANAWKAPIFPLYYHRMLAYYL